MLAILAGSGIVTGSDGERAVHAGDVVAYEPNEIHRMACSSSRLRFASRAEVDVRMGLTERFRSD
jgi:quercetin dioxygenase-like cupin family protein